MTYKKTILILFLIFSFLPSKTNAQTINVADIKKIIGENTPEFIAKPIILTVNAVEKFRSDMGMTAENKKLETQAAIKELNGTKIPPDSVSEIGKFRKYFTYLKLYFYSFLSIILNNQLIFYFSLVTIIFLILRYIFNLIL